MRKLSFSLVVPVDFSYFPEIFLSPFFCYFFLGSVVVESGILIRLLLSF